MTTSPRLGFTYLADNQATPETAVNEIAAILESAAGHFIFKDRDLATPPGSPSNGDCYLVDTSATDAWAGQDGNIAFRLNTGWLFIAPTEGFTAWVNDEDVFVGYDGSAWNTLSAPSGAVLTAANNLSDVADAATAWTNIGGGTSGKLDVDTDTTLAADSDTAIPSQAAVKAYVDAQTGTAPTESFIIACSDESTALTTGTGKVTFRMPYAFTVTDVRASVNTAPTGAPL